LHSNGISKDLIGGGLGYMLDAAGLTAYAGPPTGYVITFSNGLVVYLSGYTGITAEQESVVRGHCGPKLAVMNIGDTFTTSPKEAAYVLNQLIKPSAVIASHVNEAATKDGKVVPSTKTETFIKASSVPVHLPLSGRTMDFDSDVVNACHPGDVVSTLRRNLGFGGHETPDQAASTPAWLAADASDAEKRHLAVRARRERRGDRAAL